MLERSVDSSFSKSSSPISTLYDSRQASQNTSVRKNSHLVALHKIESQRDLFDRFVGTVYSLLGVRKYDVRLLVITGQRSLRNESLFDRQLDWHRC